MEGIAHHACADDLVIQELAANEARLTDELALTTSMLESYRSLAHQAMAQYASTTTELRQVRAQNLYLREELRRYTAAAVLGRAA